MMGPPRTPLSKIERANSCTPGASRATEEKILVTVRMRPLNWREHAKYDLIAWECPDDQTIVFKNPNPERPPTKYSFGILITISLLLFVFLCFSFTYIESVHKDLIASLSSLLLLLDKVFEPTCATHQVYEGGSRDVALSALAGTNGNLADILRMSSF